MILVHYGWAKFYALFVICTSLFILIFYVIKFCPWTDKLTKSAKYNINDFVVIFKNYKNNFLIFLKFPGIEISFRTPLATLMKNILVHLMLIYFII